MTIFSYVEIALILVGIYVIFCKNELRCAGRVLRGGGVTGVGMLLFTPIPIAVAIAFYSGTAREIARKAHGKRWDVLYQECVDKLWWVDPAGIAVSAVLIGLTFLVFGATDDRPNWDNRLARDGWQDPASWERATTPATAHAGETPRPEGPRG